MEPVYTKPVEWEEEYEQWLDEFSFTFEQWVEELEKEAYKDGIPFV